MHKAMNRAALAAGVCGALLVGMPAVANAQVNVSIYESSGTPAVVGSYGAPLGSFTAPAVDFGTSAGWHPFDQQGDFAAVVTGFLNVASTGTYSFTVYSDDGNVTKIDGNTLIDNWGPWSGIGVTNSMYLTAGLHPFHIDYMECCGNPGAGLVMVLPQDVTYAVPEPETYAMLLAGLGVLGAAVRRRKTR